MPLSNQVAAYKDCYELFDAAVNNEKGARALIGDHNKALMFRMRMNHSRVLLRDQSKRAYDRTHSLWGTCEYDAFIVRIKEDEEGQWWAYVEPASDIQTIEAL